MIAYKDDKLYFYWEDEILFCDYNVDEVNLEFVNFGIQKRIEITKNKPCVMISDIRKIKRSTREGRERMAQKDAANEILAVGIIINSKVQKVIYNFFHTIHTQQTPSKLFNNKEEAVKWIQQYLPKKDEE